MTKVQGVIEDNDDKVKSRVSEEMDKIFNFRSEYKLDYDGAEENEENMKEELHVFMEDEWQKIEEYEVKLAEIELLRRKTLDQAELDVQRQKELLEWEKDQELRDIEEQQENLLELQEELKTSLGKAEKEYSKVIPSLEKTIKKEKEELEHIDKKIRNLGGYQVRLMRNANIEFADEEKDLSKISENTGENKSDQSSKRSSGDSSVQNAELSGSMDSLKVEKGLSLELPDPEQRRMSELDLEVERLVLLRKEKSKSITDNELSMMEKMNSLEVYRAKIQENEEKLCELECGYNERQEKHEEKMEMCLETLRQDKAEKISDFDVEREKYVDLLWKEFEEIEKTLQESCKDPNIPENERKKLWEKAVNCQKKIVLDLVKEKLGHIGSLDDKLFLECLAKRSKLERDEERVLDQERKISDDIRGSMREKELAMQKLTAQKDKFHVERERERKLIKSRLKRISRLKTYDDLQSEETVEYLSEEATKLKEACEKLEEADSRFV